MSERPKVIPARPTSAHPAVLGRGDTLGRYVILDLLGQGGMGCVYAAYDSDLDRKLAVKVLRSDGHQSVNAREGQARLLREAQAMARISHPNVISVHDVGTLGDGVFLAMELVQGRTLRAWLKEPRAPGEILEAFVQAGRGLLAAHQAGLVHRDFKPENVLVGDDGRVFVTDFGLARLVSHTAEPERPADVGTSAESLPLDTPLTRVGTVMGTPRYMSPEQHLGKIPDARSDQFSFCAALYWALYRVRPFEPERLAAAARSQDSESEETTRPLETDKIPTPVQEPPRDRRIPSRVRNALMKGLSLSPEDRFESLQALLEVLERPPRPRWPYLAAALLMAAAVLGGTWGYHRTRDAERVCSGAPRKLAGIWDPTVRARMREVFVRGGGAGAQEAFDRLAQALDRYTGRWSGEFYEACAATSLRKEQPESVLAVRMVCLDEALNELGAVTHELARPDARPTEHAVQAVEGLPNPSACADVSALTRRAPLPTDPAARQTLTEAQKLLARARGLALLDQREQAAAAAHQVLTLAARVVYPPLTADALLFQGQSLVGAGRFQDAQAQLERAFREADAGEADEMRVQIANELIYTADQRSHFEDAHRWEQVSQAILKRIGGNAELESDLFDDLAVLARDENRPEDAARFTERALALLEGIPGASGAKIADLQSNLANIYLSLHPEKVEALEKRAIERYVQLYGPESSALAEPYLTLAQLADSQRRFDEGLSFMGRAIVSARRGYGEQSPKVGDFYSGEATLLQHAGRYDEAIADYRRSLAIYEKTLAPDNLRFAYANGGIGQCLVEAGRLAEARPWLEKALAFPLEDRLERGTSRFALARALWPSEKSRALARKLASQAKADFLQADHPADAARAAAWLSRNAR